MKVIKEKELIIFDFEDGKTATYNMNTGETIGKMGKPVKSLQVALSGYNIQDVLNSFEDKGYRNFLMYVQNNLVSHRYDWRQHEYVSRVTNLGTLLNTANGYKTLSQYIIAGIDANCYIRTPLKDVPKGLLKLCRNYNMQISDNLIKRYSQIPNEYNTIFSMEFENINDAEKWDIMEALVPSYYGNGRRLLTDFNYNFKALLKYIDYLCTFEGLSACESLVREIGDYANMMSQISHKFEKYPRYFLSTHKIAVRNYMRLKQEFDEKRFAERIKPEYEITYKDYKFFYPRTIQEIKDEAVQQHNCVASYIDRVINGSCDILFLRKKDTPNKSAVTIEVRNGKIVQALQAYNRAMDLEQQAAVDAFNRKFG